MDKQNKLIWNRGLQVTTLGFSALLLASPVSAQSSLTDQSKQASQNPQVEQAALAEFKKLDRNKDQKLQWEEIEPQLEQADLKDKWNQKKLMSEFDENGNDALEPQEYQLFFAETGQGESRTGQTAQTQEKQQREVELESADVKVDPGKPEVEVTQKSPDVRVQQAETDVSVERQPPQVEVTQPKPEVIVTQPKPEVEVIMPKPEVEVTQQDPDINVDQSQPDVQIKQQKPEVSVTRGQPEIEVEEQKPEVVLKREKPDVTMADSQQPANVQTRQDDEQAQLQIEQSEPQVEVTQSEPEVTVETAGQADVNVQREGQKKAPGEQQERGQETAAQDSGQLETMSIDELIGHKIENSNGDELGEVDQVVVSEAQGTAGIVLSIGGVLGIGADQVMAPLDELSLQDGRLVWKTSRTKDELKKSGDYQKENHREVSSSDYLTVGELKQSVSQ